MLLPRRVPIVSTGIIEPSDNIYSSLENDKESLSIIHEDEEYNSSGGKASMKRRYHSNSLLIGSEKQYLNKSNLLRSPSFESVFGNRRIEMSNIKQFNCINAISDENSIFDKTTPQFRHKNGFMPSPPLLNSRLKISLDDSFSIPKGDKSSSIDEEEDPFDIVPEGLIDSLSKETIELLKKHNESIDRRNRELPQPNLTKNEKIKNHTIKQFNNITIANCNDKPLINKDHHDLSFMNIINDLSNDKNSIDRIYKEMSETLPINDSKESCSILINYNDPINYRTNIEPMIVESKTVTCSKNEPTNYNINSLNYYNAESISCIDENPINSYHLSNVTDNKIHPTCNSIFNNNKNVNNLISSTPSNPLIFSNYSRDNIENESINKNFTLSNKVNLKQYTHSCSFSYFDPISFKSLNNSNTKEFSINLINADSKIENHNDASHKYIEEFGKYRDKSIGSNSIKYESMDANMNQKSYIATTNLNAHCFNNFNMIVINDVDYCIIDEIGKGGFSAVFKCLNLKNKKMVAIKNITLSENDHASMKNIRQEIHLLKKFSDSKNIINLFDSCINEIEKKVYIITELGDFDLKSQMESVNFSDRPIFFQYCWEEILYAVETLHFEGIVHSDLKPANFVFVGPHLKLIDFGIAKVIQADRTSVTSSEIIGTFNYMSPEAILDISDNSHPSNIPRLKISTKSDVWSLGCILYSFLFRQTPFDRYKNLSGKLYAIVNNVIEIPPLSTSINQNVSALLKKCFNHNPKERPTVHDLIQQKTLLSNN